MMRISPPRDEKRSLSIQTGKTEDLSEAAMREDGKWKHKLERADV